MCKLLKCSLHHPSKTEHEGEMSHWKSQRSGACEVTVSLWSLSSVLLSVRILIEVSVTYLLHDSFPMFGSLLEIAYKFIRFNTACSLWHPCLMLLKVLIFFLSSFPNKTMLSFDLLIMIHTVESDLFFYLFHNGMSDIDAIISFKWFLVCSLCNRIYIKKSRSWVAYS